MSNFVNAMQTSYTDNGATTLKSSGSKCVDLFGQAGSIRAWDTTQVEKIFLDAFSEDPLTATKIAFYLRDVRGGQGERKTFRIISNWLAENHPEVLSSNLEHIPFYGRYDDLVELFFSSNKLVSEGALSHIRSQLVDDLKSDNPSLLAKWLMSTNTSSKNTREKGFKLANALKLNNKKYRKTLSLLRSKINIVESKMCAGQWDDISYEHVPSRASNIYKKAFRKHDPEGYEAFVGKVEKGEATINVGTLYPYEIVKPLASLIFGYGKQVTDNDKREADMRWKALPDYIEGQESAIVVADTSGSMNGDPINVSISLAIYMAERNTGPFKNCWINFSDRPEFSVLKGDTLSEKISNMGHINARNTDFNAVFDLILGRAKASNLSSEDLPSTVIVISDMQFDEAAGDGSYLTNFEQIKQKYTNSGYKMPKLVFWNVDAHGGQSPVTAGEKGTALVSGFSPSAFKIVASLDDSITPYGIMMDVINNERYERITI